MRNEWKGYLWEVYAQRTGHVTHIDWDVNVGCTFSQLKTYLEGKHELVGCCCGLFTSSVE